MSNFNLLTAIDEAQKIAGFLKNTTNRARQLTNRLAFLARQEILFCQSTKILEILLDSLELNNRALMNEIKNKINAFCGLYIYTTGKKGQKILCKDEYNDLYPIIAFKDGITCNLDNTRKEHKELCKKLAEQLKKDELDKVNICDFEPASAPSSKTQAEKTSALYKNILKMLKELKNSEEYFDDCIEKENILALLDACSIVIPALSSEFVQKSLAEIRRLQDELNNPQVKVRKAN